MADTHTKQELPDGGQRRFSQELTRTETGPQDSAAAEHETVPKREPADILVGRQPMSVEMQRQITEEDIDLLIAEGRDEADAKARRKQVLLQKQDPLPKQDPPPKQGQPRKTAPPAFEDGEICVPCAHDVRNKRNVSKEYCDFPARKAHGYECCTRCTLKRERDQPHMACRRAVKMGQDLMSPGTQHQQHAKSSPQKPAVRPAGRGMHPLGRMGSLNERAMEVVANAMLLQSERKAQQAQTAVHKANREIQRLKMELEETQLAAMMVKTDMQAEHIYALRVQLATKLKRAGRKRASREDSDEASGSDEETLGRAKSESKRRRAKARSEGRSKKCKVSPAEKIEEGPISTESSSDDEAVQKRAVSKWRRRDEEGAKKRRKERA
ncbi:hypothetical protein B0A55_01393 [Friedmanniomyces simplex]|uniref:Uncharacterized protein n=1 Tax=Friedmanniomyces simplex TaxID=329884 RepID=A0A4U0Y0N2_9PEZI|nr:hypothetical protein B0A55_01393 [Friedmanniomyces simplex]